jgi:predicted hotdog family 3-hydroxylacyl-ACP dehydratase
MDFTQIDIRTLVPQQPPFVMVDKMLACDETSTKTALLVQDDNIFSENGVLTEAGIIENIAQSCASRMGFRSKFLTAGDGEIKIGVLGSIKNLNIYRLPKNGETLTTEIEVVNDIFNINLITGKIEIKNELIAECEMKISIH